MTLQAALHRAFIWGPVAAYLGLIYYLSSRPQVGWVSGYPDTLLHALEYLGLAVLVARALNDGFAPPAPARRLGLAFMLCLAWAVSDEIHQSFVPNRSSDWRDVASDAVGTTAGLAIATAMGHALRRRAPR